MNNYKEIALGSEAIEYFRERLSWGHTLSQYLLNRLDVENGSITAAFPPEANLELVNRLEYGGILPTPPESEWKKGKNSVWIPKPKFYKYVIENIRLFLEKSTRNLCIFEDFIAKPTDPSLERCETEMSIFKEEVHHLLRGGKHSPDEVATVISWAESFVLTGALTSLPDEEHDILPVTPLTSDLLVRLAERTEKIIMLAYDGEAYVIWNRGT